MGNANLWRTIFGFLAGIGFLGIVVQLLGCNALPTGAYDCSVSTWLPPQYQGIAALVLLALGGLFKMFGGTGSITQKLFNEKVPVVPIEQTKPGVVTEDQVQAPK